MGEAAKTRARIDVRTWPRMPATAQIILLDVAMEPTADDVDQWVRDILHGPDGEPGRPVDAIRTGALFPQAARSFAMCGFEEIDRLALLERRLDPTERLPRREQRSAAAIRPLRRRDLTAAAEIDAISFGDGWQNDADTLDDIRTATPTARSRRATLGGRCVGFAITGRAARTGYLQRIAVAPELRGRGIGRALVDDALRWLSRRGASTVLVNTGVDNTAALSLYEQCGFDRRDDELVVMERRR